MVVTGAFAAPWLLMGLAMWSADGPWTFEGRGLAHWVLVRGSHLDRLGAVAPQPVPVRYSVSLPEGTFPGWRIATYASRALPRAVGAGYAERCRGSTFKITQETGDDSRFVLVCEIAPYLDVEIVAERPVHSDTTSVVLKVWGSD